MPIKLLSSVELLTYAVIECELLQRNFTLKWTVRDCGFNGNDFPAIFMAYATRSNRHYLFFYSFYMQDDMNVQHYDLHPFDHVDIANYPNVIECLDEDDARNTIKMMIDYLAHHFSFEEYPTKLSMSDDFMMLYHEINKDNADKLVSEWSSQDERFNPFLKGLTTLNSDVLSVWLMHMSAAWSECFLGNVNTFRLESHSPYNARLRYSGNVKYFSIDDEDDGLLKPDNWTDHEFIEFMKKHHDMTRLGNL